MEIINYIQYHIYNELSKHHEVYDVVDLDQSLPFIRIADYNYTRERDKCNLVTSYDITQQIHIWSDYKGKKEINELVDSVIDILENINYVDLDFIENEVSGVSVTDYDGYKQAVINLNLKIDL